MLCTHAPMQFRMQIVFPGDLPVRKQQIADTADDRHQIIEFVRNASRQLTDGVVYKKSFEAKLGGRTMGPSRVKYMRFMMDTFFKDEPMNDLNKGLFAFASYHAGPGRIR